MQINTYTIQYKNIVKFIREFSDLIAEMFLENDIKIYYMNFENCCVDNEGFITFGIDLGHNVKGEILFCFNTNYAVDNIFTFSCHEINIYDSLKLYIDGSSRAKKYKLCEYGNIFRLIYSTLSKYAEVHLDISNPIDLNELRLELDMNGLSSI